MTTSRWFASLFLTATLVPALSAETHCPGNVASVPLRLVNRYQIVLPVFINHSGPYDFLLDTGADTPSSVPPWPTSFTSAPRARSRSRVPDSMNLPRSLISTCCKPAPTPSPVRKPSCLAS